MNSPRDPSSASSSKRSEAKGPEDFAALSEIHEGGVVPGWKNGPLWGALIFCVGLLIVVWAVWRFGPGPKVARPNSPVASTAIGAAESATLILRTDAPCELTMVGEAAVRLNPGEAHEVTVKPGEAALSCVSTEIPTVRTNQIRQLDVGTRVIVNLELADEVNARRKDVAEKK
jgi:hypothetical protein